MYKIQNADLITKKGSELVFSITHFAHLPSQESNRRSKISSLDDELNLRTLSLNMYQQSSKIINYNYMQSIFNFNIQYTFKCLVFLNFALKLNCE